MTRNEPVSCTVAVKTLSRQTFPVLGLKGNLLQIFGEFYGQFNPEI